MMCPKCETELERQSLVLGDRHLCFILVCPKCDWDIPESEVGRDGK